MATFTPTSRLHAAASPPARGRVARRARSRWSTPVLLRSARKPRPREDRSPLAVAARARAKDDARARPTELDARVPAADRSAAARDAGTRRPRGRRDACFALVAATFSSSVASLPSPARAANDAVLAALRKKETSDTMEGGAVQTRLNLALDELRRARTLAKVGEYAEARALLRQGALVSVRTDCRAVGAYLRVQRPTFDQFEGLAVTGGLDAFDNAMRAMQQGVPEVTARDVDVNAKAAVAALEEVCYVLGKDTTYEAMKERLEGGEEKRNDEKARRDFLAEERAILSDARIGAE